MLEDVFGICGSTLAGAYQVEEVIAEGGFGVVYRAEHVAFRAPIALKCLKIPGTIPREQADVFIDNFREEAEILFHLSAQIPEVVRPLHADAFRTETGAFVPYIAMEWIEGKPLDSIILLRDQAKQPPLGLKKVVRMLAPVAHALARAHHFQVPGGATVSVVHCDLKPENILITGPENPVRAKILDYGIARARDKMAQRVGRITESEEGHPFTPAYGAPEQWVPKRYGQTGPWTDVWGLALTMVETLSGQPPIDGDMHAMMGTALDPSRRPTPRNEGVDVRDQVEAVFRRALAVDPRERYQEVESFWTELERACGIASSFDRIKRMREDVEREESVEPQKSPFEEYEDPFAVSTGDWAAVEIGGKDEPFGLDSGEFQLDAPGSGGEIELAIGPPVPSRPGAVPSSRSGADRSGTHDPLGGSGSRPRPAVASGQYAAPLSHGARPPAAVAAGRSHVRGPAQPVERDVRSKLARPLAFFLLGLAVTLTDVILAATGGANLALGPLRVRWIGAAVAVIGLSMAFWSLLSDKESE